MRTTLENVLKKPRIDRAHKLPLIIRIPLLRRYSRWWMALLLILSDVISLFFSVWLAVYLRSMIEGNPHGVEFRQEWVVVLSVFLLVYALRGLYPGVGVSPVEELRRLTVSTSVVFLMLTAFTFWLRQGESYSRLEFAFTWIFALLFVQAGRWLVRIIAIRLELWGEPVVVMGHETQGYRLVEFLMKNLRLGLRPVLAMDWSDDCADQPAFVPVLHLDTYDNIEGTLEGADIDTALLVTSEVPECLQDKLVDGQSFGFKRVILIADFSWIGSTGVVPYDLEGFLGLEMSQNLLNHWQQIIKRVLDLILAWVSLILISPLLFLISALIHFDSPGGILYSQDRVGKGGKKFKMWKFRTMVKDADKILDEYLAKNPLMRAEWNATQKIQNDPRITSVGRVLRRLSLDELPQLYNVIKGNMSLVGPRPFFPDQKERYGRAYRLYVRVSPGITGMWQVSGRNETTFSERAHWDMYYVRQWSIWLDIYILLRTMLVVLRRDGAY